ncbi:hypothetical protein CRYUN_Cryun09bG0025400 [Craigia yunnanensis]
MCKECEKDLEKGLSPRPAQLAETIPPPSPTTPRPALVLSNSRKALVASNSGKALVVLIPAFDKKKYVKQVTGRHNDTELHLGAQRGDVGAIRQIKSEIDDQMMGTLSGAEFDAEPSRKQ